MMSNLQSDFIEFNISKFGYNSIEELIENLYIQAIIDSYSRIDNCIATENDIRDRFIYDFYYGESSLKQWLQLKIIHINWERWLFKEKNKLGRADLSFEMSGFDFIVECKRLKDASNKYINEGLQRFIKNEYAEKDSYSAMLGFVINNKSLDIKNKLYDKCKNVNYINNDFSKSNIDNWLGFKSAHLRVDKSEINVFHLFFEFNKVE